MTHSHFYRDADLMVHAAERESFGLMIAEAMACGLPVVASAAAGPADIVLDGVTGRLIALGDESGLAPQWKCISAILL